MSKFHTAAAVILLGVALAGCSSTPVAPPPVTPAAASAPARASASPSAVPGQPKPVAASTVATVTLPPHLDPRSTVSTERSVFFDFDDFSIKREHRGLVEVQGKYLMSRPDLAIKIEGNADERGSHEYNLALGQKRAEAVLKALKISGVKDSQMEAVSWGEERAKAVGHDEASWAQNRRADLVYPQR